MSNPFGLDEKRMLNDPRDKMWAWIVLKRDGNMICAHLNDFVDLQESSAGFGETAKDAIADLLINRKLRCHKAMWWGTGMPAGLCGEPAYTNEIHPNSLAMLLCQTIARCPQHGGFDIPAAAELALFYRVDESNRIEFASE
jgi:hypothetical protein